MIQLYPRPRFYLCCSHWCFSLVITVADIIYVAVYVALTIDVNFTATVFISISIYIAIDIAVSISVVISIVVYVYVYIYVYGAFDVFLDLDLYISLSVSILNFLFIYLFLLLLLWVTDQKHINQFFNTINDILLTPHIIWSVHNTNTIVITVSSYWSRSFSFIKFLSNKKYNNNSKIVKTSLNLPGKISKVPICRL